MFAKRTTRRRVAAALLGILPLLGCAGDMVALDDDAGRYRHQKLGYTIPHPVVGFAPDAPAWQRTTVAGADIAFREPNGARMAIRSACSLHPQQPSILARRLVFGLADRDLLAEGPTPLAGREAWVQTYRATSEGTRVEIKTVTLIVDDCVIDWLLVAPDHLAAAESSFDAWWAGFEPAARPETPPAAEGPAS